MLDNLISAAALSAEDVAAKIKSRREKWTPRTDGSGDHAQTIGETVYRVVQKVDGSTLMLETERPQGSFSSTSLTDAAGLSAVAESLSGDLAKSAK
jgi:hypothetical protein